MLGIDLFSGAGGLSVGAKLAGIDVKVAIESDPHAAATYRYNHQNIQLLCSDIRTITELPNIRTKQPLIVFGGPPCQGFSTSNQKTRSSNNPNNWLFREFVRLVKRVRPDWVLFENVKGILETERGVFIEQIALSFEQIGYSVSYFVLNSVDYGVPQKRARFFLVGNLQGISIKQPPVSEMRAVTVHQAIADLPSLDNGASESMLQYRHAATSSYAQKMRGELEVCANHLVTKNSEIVIRRFEYVPQGGNWEDIPDDLMDNYKDKSRCHTGIYHRLQAHAPSVVIGNYRKNMLIHPFEHRGLSVRESARLQSFPDWFEFKGSIGFQQQQVGNAVPPLLAKAVFEQILRAG